MPAGLDCFYKIVLLYWTLSSVRQCRRLRSKIRIFSTNKYRFCNQTKYMYMPTSTSLRLFPTCKYHLCILCGLQPDYYTCGWWICVPIWVLTALLVLARFSASNSLSSQSRKKKSGIYDEKNRMSTYYGS